MAKYRSGIEVCEERGIDTTKNITAGDLMAADLPMVVACTHCSMTMVVTNCWVAEDGHTFCWECAGIEPN